MSRASVSRCPRNPQKLEVSVVFEPNRMAAALLQAAYLRVAPVVRRSLGHVPAAPAALGSQLPLERAEVAERSVP